jgi:hypothetical protein
MFDIHGMGLGGAIPHLFLFIYAIVNLLLLYTGNHKADTYAGLMEVIFPVSTAIFSLLLLRDVLELPGRELLSAFPVTKTYFGLLRLIRYYGIFAVEAGTLLAVIGLLAHIPTAFIIFIIALFISQTLFALSFIFLFMSLLHDSFYSSVVFAGYMIFYLLTRSELFSSFSIFLFHTVDPDYAIDYISILRFLIYDAIMLSIAHIVYKKVT